MASSEVDQKFLGKFAKVVEPDNPLLASMLFKILGLSISLSQQMVKARKQRRLDTSRNTPSLHLYLHIIWLSNQGLIMLEQYVLPLVGHYVELKVLAYKLRASFYHIFVLFHNHPPVTTMNQTNPDGPAMLSTPPTRLDKGKGVEREEDGSDGRSSVQPTHVLEGGPVGGAPLSVRPPPGFGHDPPAAFILPAGDFLPVAHTYFKQAVSMAEELLWGSHSLRLSVKTEYAAFLYECMHDGPGSRKLAKDTITEVYEAAEGIDNDMFNDACELVTVLGRMMKRGLGSAANDAPADGALDGVKGEQQQQKPPATSAPAPPPTSSIPTAASGAVTGQVPPPMPTRPAAPLTPPRNSSNEMPGFI